MSTESSHPPRPEAAMAPISRSHRPSTAGPADEIEKPFPLKMEGKVEKGFGRGSRELGIPTANLPSDSIHPLTSLSLTGIYYGFVRIHPSTSSSSTTSIASTLGSVIPIGERPNGILGDFGPRTLTGEEIGGMEGRTAAYPEVEQESDGPASGSGNVDGNGIAEEKEKRKGNRELKGEDFDVWPMVMSVGWNPYYKNEKLTAEVHIMHQFPADFYGHHMSVLVLGYIRPELNYVSKEALIDDINTDVKVALASLARPIYAASAKDPFFLKVKQ